MRKKSWLKYCIYIFIFIAFLLLKEFVAAKLKYSYERYWGAGNSYLLLITVPLIFNLIIGMLLGFEHFVNEMRKAGIWKINLAKLAIFGIPSLFLSLAYHFMYINITFIQMGFWSIASHFVNDFPVFQILFGYVVITCFYKYQESEME